MGWSKKYKKSIDCNNPKGFSQKAHCAGRKKRENKMSLKLEELVGKKLTEEQFDEAAGKKDACYYKVKSRYDVWPSAYASGALVKCRKVGAKNWGNKSKKEGLADKFKKNIDKYNKKAKKSRDYLKKLKKKEGVNEAKYTHNYPSITAMAKDYERIFPSTGPAGGVKIMYGSKREATGKRSQPAFIRIEGDKKLIDAYKKIAFNGRGNYSDVIKSIKESVVKLNKSDMDKLHKNKSVEKGDDKIIYDESQAYDIWAEDGSFGYTMTGIVEAEYGGRKVKLGKPMQGDVKKFKVYVKNPKGNVVKVNFGHGGSSAKGKTMKIRKSNPKARANFRARHNCDNPGPRHKARYWSCKKW